jgi:hypothetical protein
MAPRLAPALARHPPQHLRPCVPTRGPVKKALAPLPNDDTQQLADFDRLLRLPGQQLTTRRHPAALYMLLDTVQTVPRNLEPSAELAALLRGRRN